MKKTVILCLLLPMTLFYPLIPIIAGSVTSSENIILSQGSVIYVNPSPNPSPSSFPNLAVIPNGWNLNSYYPSYCAEPYIFVDDSVTHYGNPSIRLDQGGPEDPYYPGVIDRAAWLIRRYPAQPGDHIVFKIWIKTDLNSEKENNIYSGGRAGLDGYLGNKPLSSSNSPDSQGIVEVWVTPHVQWSSDWTQVVIDTIIPSNYELDNIIAWIQVQPGNDPHSVWFADAEFYINPT